MMFRFPQKHRMKLIFFLGGGENDDKPLHRVPCSNAAMVFLATFWPMAPLVQRGDHQEHRVRCCRIYEYKNMMLKAFGDLSW